MDLTRMLNTDAGAPPATASPPAPAKQPPHPHPPPPPPSARQPSTPVQAAQPHPFRDYGQPPHPSPARQMSHDGYGPGPGPGQPPLAQTPGAPPPPPYASSPSGYPGPGTYGSRPVPPPLQPVMGPDTRSPSLGAMPAPSPYRQTPMGTPGGAASGGYSFPQTQAHPTPTSPSQRHQPLPPASAYPPRSDSFSHPQPHPHAPGPGPVGMTGPHGASLYMQSPMPQTPPVGSVGPVGTPGGAHPGLHQRSQSTHSTPTPTSAQSQHHYGPPYGQQTSPVMSHHGLPPSQQQQQQQQHQHQQQQHQTPLLQHQSQPHPQDYYRQGSQPPTPLGPPLPSGPPQRMSSGGGYAQPPSPYQQRGSFLQHAHIQASPIQPTPPPLPKLPSGHQPYDAESQRRSQSRSERDRSISISPKTRVPSLPSSSGQPASGPPSASAHAPNQDQDYRPSSVSRTLTAPSVSSASIDAGRERAGTPGKRKMDDRDLHPDDIARQEPRPPPFDNINGSRVSTVAGRASTSPVLRRKKRRFVEVPIWAQSTDELKRQAKLRQDDLKLRNANLTLRKTAHSQVNGKRKAVSRNSPTPEPSRDSNNSGMNNVNNSSSSSNAAARPPIDPARKEILSLLGPWEPTITNKKPQDTLIKAVQDFLYFTVISNPNMGEINSRGIQFEIEAKLGICISKDTNNRIKLPVVSECVLESSNRIAFRSSMTEEQHRGFNAFLNDNVKEAHALNPEAVAVQRVQIDYKHLREVDRFFELPREMQDRLPACIRNYNQQQGRHGAKVRVTYESRVDAADGTTRSLVPIATIIKARVGDLDIHFPLGSLDCRISVNLEMPWDGPVEEIERLGASDPARTPDRNKDRLSYRQGPYQIDLTQVTQTVIGLGNTPQLKKEHELELELSAEHVLRHGQLLVQGAPHCYTELIDGMVDNIRVLVGQAAKWQPA